MRRAKAVRMRRIWGVLIVLVCLRGTAHGDECACDVTPAACDASCACDLECAVDWSVDECALPGADCLPDTGDVDDATLDAEELATPDDEVTSWDSAPDALSCPDGAHAQDGACVADATLDIDGGCSTTRAVGIASYVAVALLLLLARRRRRLLCGLFIACSLSSAESWDDAVEAGPTGDRDAFVDVFAAPLGDGDGARYLLAHEALPPGAGQPVAAFALSKLRVDRPIFRAGDRLTNNVGDELLGWARDDAGQGTAELIELASPGPDGARTYETDAASIDQLVAQGFAVTAHLGYVWPPGIADPVPVDEVDPDPVAAPKPCAVSVHSATRSSLVLLYASPGNDYAQRFLVGCPGEVVVGEKRETGPVGRMRLLESKAAGGRTGFVLDRHGDKLRALLLRDNGVERTRQYLKHKMELGYDYIVIDEITAAPDFRDGTTLNRRLRRLLGRMPARTIIPYISIDLTQQAGGFQAMQERKLLLRAFKLKARGLALEIYLHTPQVMAGAAPATFRLAADRLALSVRGLKRAGGINLRAISVIGTSMHSSLAQYRYLDQPAHDLASLARQVNAIRHGSKRLRQQNGVGYYFVNRSDMAPLSGAPYSYDGLIRRMRLEALRFR
jgi:hypothetical protein